MDASAWRRQAMPCADAPPTHEASRFQRQAITVLVTLAAWAMLSGSALAASQVFMDEQGLSAGNAKASASFHKGVYEVEGNANHTHCPAVAQGYGGYTSTPFSGGNFTAYLPCGPHYQFWLPNGTGNINFHGAEYNPNGSTFDFFDFARYYWQ